MRATLVALSLLPALTLAMPLGARAQDAPLPDVVVTATRTPTPVEDVPAGVSVVDRQTIELRDYTSVTQALSAVPGLRVSQSGGAGGNASVFVRGANSNQVLVLRDGVPLNDASDSSGAFNFGIDTLADVERIEVVRGPMAALYGSGAIGGVINFITRQGTEDGPHVSGEIAGGYPRQVLGDAAVTGVSGPFDYAAIFESQSQEGFDSTPPRESVYTGTPQGFRTQIGTLNLGVSPIEGTRIGLLLRARTSTFGFDALGSPTFDDANSTGNADELLGRLGARTRLFGGVLDASASVGRLQDDRKYTEALAPADPNQATNDSRYHAYRTDVQVNNVVHLDRVLTTPYLNQTDVTFGYEHIADNVNVRVGSAGLFGPFAQAARAHLDSDAGYAGVQTTVLERLTLTGQLRQESVANNDPFTWRVGAVASVPEALTRFKASYGTSFREASLFDRFGVDSFGYAGNPNLRPETSQGWELGFTTTVPAGGQPDFVSFGTTYFNTQVVNLIETVFSPVYTAVNIGSAHLQGFETELSLHPCAWFAAQASWTYTEANDADAGTQLLRRPLHAAAFNAQIKPVPELTIAPEVLLTGAFHDFLIDDTGNSSVQGTSRQGIVVNATLTYQLRPHVQLFAAGRNILDTRFEPVNGYATPGASFLAGVRVKL